VGQHSWIKGFIDPDEVSFTPGVYTALLEELGGIIIEI
jgi:hypothetical protein